MRFSYGVLKVLFLVALLPMLASIVSLRGEFLIIALVSFRPTLMAIVHVGTDGLGMRFLGMTRYVPYADVEDVAHVEGESRIMLGLRDGKQLKLSLDPAVRANVVVARLRQAIANAKRVPDTQMAALPREVRQLRSLVENAHYREPSPARDVLWRVVEDPAIAPATRARAAVALSASLEPEERTRLRVVASGTASPKLRVAFDAAAAPEIVEAELERALEAVEKNG